MPWPIRVVHYGAFFGFGFGSAFGSAFGFLSWQFTASGTIARPSYLSTTEHFQYSCKRSGIFAQRRFFPSLMSLMPRVSARGPQKLLFLLLVHWNTEGSFPTSLNDVTSVSVFLAHVFCNCGHVGQFLERQSCDMMKGVVPEQRTTVSYCHLVYLSTIRSLSYYGSCSRLHTNAPSECCRGPSSRQTIFIYKYRYYS